MKVKNRISKSNRQDQEPGAKSQPPRANLQEPEAGNKWGGRPCPPEDRRARRPAPLSEKPNAKSRHVEQALMRRLHNAARAMNDAQARMASAQEVFSMARERVELVKEIIQTKYNLDDADQVRPDGLIIKKD